jgi:hypothetical protein
MSPIGESSSISQNVIMAVDVIYYEGVLGGILNSLDNNPEGKAYVIYNEVYK